MSSPDSWGASRPAWRGSWDSWDEVCWDEACWGPDCLENCLFFLQDKQESMQEMALSDLWTYHMKETGGVARFRDGGGLMPLWRVLAGPPRSSRTFHLALDVLEICCAEEDSPELGGDPPLVTILRSLTAESIQRAWALGSLAEDSENCQAIHEAGAVLQLIQVLTTSQDSELWQSISRAVRNLANSPAYRLLLAQQGAVQGALDVERLMSSWDAAALVTVAVRALMELTKGCSRDCAEQLSLGEGVAPLVALAGHEKRAVQESALAVLANLCRQRVLRPAIGNAGGVDLLVREIQLRRGSGTPEASLHPLVRALCLLCRETINRSRVRKSGGLELLLSLLRDRDHSSLHAHVLLAFVAFFDDEEALEVLEAGGLIPLLVGRLAAQGQRAGQEEEEEEEEEKCKDEEEETVFDLIPEKQFDDWDIPEEHFSSFWSLRHWLIWKGYLENISWVPRPWFRSKPVEGYDSESSDDDISVEDRYEPLGFSFTLYDTKSHSQAESPDFFHSPILDLPLADHPNVSEALNSTEVDAAPLDQNLCPPLLAEFEDLHLGPVREDPKSDGKESQAVVGTQEQQELDWSELVSLEEELSGEDLPELPCWAVSKPVTIKTGKGDAKAKESAWISLAASQDSAGPSNSDSLPVILVPSKDDQIQLSHRPTSRFPDPEEGCSVPQKLKKVFGAEGAAGGHGHPPPSKNLPRSPGEGRTHPSCWKRRVKFRYTFEQIKLNIGGPSLFVLHSPVFYDVCENKRELCTPEAPALLLLFRFAEVEDPSRTLVTPTVLQGLLRYITGSPSPSSLCIRLLHRLTCNPTCLEAFVRCYGPSLIRTWLVLGISPEEAAAIVASEHEEEGPILDAEERGTGIFKKIGRSLLFNLCVQGASNLRGRPFFTRMLMSTCESDQAACALALPLICRNNDVCQTLMLGCFGLHHLLHHLLQDPEPSFVFYASDALSILLGSQAQNLAPIPPPALKRPCPYSVMVDEGRADLFFQLDSGCIVPALRQAVSGASEVFCAMLAGGFAESSQTTVTLHDVLPEPFLAVIHFLHGCRGKPCPILGMSIPLALAEDILVVAEQYLLPELQALVDEALSRDFLCLGTLWEVVRLADRQNRPRLLRNCVAYILLQEGSTLARRAATLAKLLRFVTKQCSDRTAHMMLATSLNGFKKGLDHFMEARGIDRY